MAGKATLPNIGLLSFSSGEILTPCLILVQPNIFESTVPAYLNDL